jgi:hypothetical protein
MFAIVAICGFFRSQQPIGKLLVDGPNLLRVLVAGARIVSTKGMRIGVDQGVRPDNWDNVVLLIVFLESGLLA